jgi:ABC-type branched-subunit amino acid transport system ATPase component
MFKIDQLSCGYGQSQILHDLDLNVAKREIVAVMGRNGMGKTTLFKSLMGILPQWKARSAWTATTCRRWKAMSGSRAGSPMCPRAA